MARKSPRSLMYNIVALKQELESRAASLLEAQRLAFQEVTLRQPRLDPPELGFHQVVSWLYCFYYEAGRISLPFLINRFPAYGLDNDGSHQAHFENMRCLRTYLQHNLDLSSWGTIGLQRKCEGWFSDNCGSAIPGNDQEWNACLVCMLTDTQELLQAVINCVREIEKDESRATMVEQWSSRLRGYHPRSEFERLIEIVAKDMGQHSLDTVRICDRYYDKWRKELNLRTGDFDFEIEARKLIEHTLLSDAEVPLPITGQDVIRSLGIPPGPQVGKLLKKARILYNDKPCSREKLLSRLIASQNSKIESE